MRAAIEKRYRDAGWAVIPCPRDAPQDFICGSSKIVHFVRLSPPDHPGLFIQNAFANIAIPIVVNGKGVCEDINLQKIIEIKPIKPVKPRVAKKAGPDSPK